jgi:hypothetical protein
VWRVRSLHDLELHHAEQGVAERAPHVHGQFEIAVVERGAMRFVSGRSAEIAPAGSLLVIPPGDVHSHHSLAEPTSRRSFFPELASLVDAASSVNAGASPNFNTMVIDDADLARRIGALHRMLATPGSLLARETSAVAAATLLVERHAVGARSAPVKRESRMVERVRRYLHDRLADNVSRRIWLRLTELPPVRDRPRVRARSACRRTRTTCSFASTVRNGFSRPAAPRRAWRTTAGLSTRAI